MNLFDRKNSLKEEKMPNFKSNNSMTRLVYITNVLKDAFVEMHETIFYFVVIMMRYKIAV